MRIILCVLLSLFIIQHMPGQVIPNEYKILVYPDSTTKLSAKDLSEKIDKHDALLLPLAKIPAKLKPEITYWLILEHESTYILKDFLFTLNNRLSKVEAYNYPYSEPAGVAGMLVPGSQKVLTGDKIILNNQSDTCLIKIENKLHALVSFNNLKIISYSDYLNDQRRKDFYHGIFQGIFMLILVYNIILYVLVRKIIHLYYVIHILLNALVIFSIDELSEKFFFPNSPYLNLVSLSFQIIGMFFYLQFLRNALLNHCSGYTLEKDKYRLFPFAYLVLIINLLISCTVVFRLDIFTTASRLSNLIVTIFCLAMFISFYRMSDRFLRIVMLGSIILIIMGYITIFISTFYVRTDIFYTSGLLIEFLVLTYALNANYFKEKYEVENRNRDLEYQMGFKDRELLNKVLQLSSKENVISSVKEKLKKLNGAVKENSQVFSTLETSDKIEKVLWSEFEKHFNSIHPEFYKNIALDYPQLSQNEIRLCAFLRLNLNTKEIATITQKSPHSIETMRSRIRQKLNLDRNASLNNFLLQKY